MNFNTSPMLVALVGGSGAGKSWLAKRLCQELGAAATSLSLDDFYRDLSHLGPAARDRINFDHPDAIDWPLFEGVLRELQNRRTVFGPLYDFASHTRSPQRVLRSPRRFIFVDGLWLLRPPHVRCLFDLRVFLNCHESLRWQRRLARDLGERGRTGGSICEQFWKVVAPMHNRFVQAQKSWADVVIQQPISEGDFSRLIETIRARRAEADQVPVEITGLRAPTPEVARRQSVESSHRGSRSERFVHSAVARAALGRRWLTWCVHWRRWLLRWRVRGSDLIKRALDVVGSTAFLLLFSPLYLALALLVRLEDGGPVLFAQIRVGRLGKHFKLYKFRSMRLNAEAELEALLAQNQHGEGITFKMKNDPRVTRVGKWLRRFSLDELPQFFNVLRGDMSLVGPRPATPREVSLYSLADRRRLAAKPGITCFWQVNGRSNIDFSGQVKLDVQYIETAGFWSDVKLLLQTVPAVVSGRGAS